MSNNGPAMPRLGSSVRLPAPLAAALLMIGIGPLPAQLADPEAVCVLGWPGVGERFTLLSDGSARCADTGLRIAEWIVPGGERGGLDAPPDRAGLGWVTPGARVVRAVRELDGAELVTLTGADLYGRPTPSLWLFRAITMTNNRPETRACRLAIRVSFGKGSGDLALRRGLVVTEGGHVGLVLSQKADDSRVVAESREMVLWFEFDLSAETGADLLLAAPSVPTLYDEADTPDLGGLGGADVVERIASRWQDRIVPETVTVGDPLVNQAFHAAVSTLMLSPPTEEATGTELGLWVSALARARQGAAAAGVVESLVEDRRSAGDRPETTDLVERADLTTALADYARHSDDPPRMSRLLWATLSASATDVAARAPEAKDSRAYARASLALGQAADVAGLLGQEFPAAEWRQHATELLGLAASGAEAAPVPGDPFGSRAHAALLASVNAPGVPAATDAELSPSERLARAHVAFVAGSTDDRLRAWQTVEDSLRTQPLPGVSMQGEAENTLVAAQLVTLVCDAICQSRSACVHLFPALPLRWAHEGLLVELRHLPSGAGPIDLRLSSRVAQATIAPLALPKGTTEVKISPPLGVEVVRLAVNGKRLKQEAFDNGPPWPIDPAAEKVTMRLARPPQESP